MNRNTRRGRGLRRNESVGRLSKLKGKLHAQADNEELSSPKPKKQVKSVAHRCVYVTPDTQEFGQTTDPPVTEAHKTHNVAASETTDEYQTLLAEQYGFDPLLADTMSPLKEFKRVICGNRLKVENSSQYTQHKCVSPMYMPTSEGSQWQNVDNIEDIEMIMVKDGKVSPIVIEPVVPRNIYISNVPRVKTIAEKFAKYKRNNLELRRLDEKVVCVEYDIFDRSSNGDILRPVQRMRAFFSVKPVFDENSNEKKEALPKLASNIKQKFNILDEDLEKLTDQEIEIIDSKIQENKSYLDDFRHILKRKQIINAKKNKSSLDLRCLYEMAIRDKPPLDSDFSHANLLSKAELQEVKDLILQRCGSSVHGISRRRVKKKERGSPIDVNVISESIMAEMLR